MLSIAITLYLLVLNLNLSDCTNLEILPKYLKVGSHLYLAGCSNLTFIPEKLKNGDRFNFSDFKFIEDNYKEFSKRGWGSFQIGYDFTYFIELYFDTVEINLSECVNLKSIPENLQRGVKLNLKGCIGLTKLPEKVIVLDTLNLSDCVSLKELPENFYLIGSYTSPSYTGPKIKY